jgi:glycine dehydrogenase subunit 1
LALPKPAAPIVDRLATKGILAGVPASRLFPGDATLANVLLIAVTETNTDSDVDALVAGLQGAL